MKKMLKTFALGCCLLAATAFQADASSTAVKPSPDATVKMLQEGNARFVANKSIHPHSDTNRLIQAGKENQGDHA
ncbi:MAG: carbonic anhydrase, partial [Desulfobulbaceae bacterium]|nr:carbonic anhydrase [Desulfobulbaceae bacterium]